ncbi:hypothetical protein [Burkholderia ubonensis]|uniref:hypothetical protein n=1 Tax=Burkholderia ubonensis TaxID=101571 RepID=UPI0012FB4C47
MRTPDRADSGRAVGEDRFGRGRGRHAAAVRERGCRAAAWLGVPLDPSSNARHGPRISTPDSLVSVRVIPTDEEWMIASHTLDLLGA